MPMLEGAAVCGLFTCAGRCSCLPAVAHTLEPAVKDADQWPGAGLRAWLGTCYGCSTNPSDANNSYNQTLPKQMHGI